MYLEVIEAAASDARRQAVILERTSQPPHHPARLTSPASRYLRGFLPGVLAHPPLSFRRQRLMSSSLRGKVVGAGVLRVVI